MKTLIVGASGCLGGILHHDFQKLGETRGTFCGHPFGNLLRLDVGNPDDVRRLIGSFQPDIVLQTAALSHVDGCEENPAESHRVNVEGTRHLVDALQGSPAKLVFFSSDYVFDGKNGPYGEEDPPNPIQVYGRHKLEAERLVQEQCANHLIIRIHGLFGWERQGKNFVMRLIQLLRDGKPMVVPTDQVGSPTYAPNLSEALQELVHKDGRGVYHLVGSTVLDRYTFARLAAKIFRLDDRFLVPKTTAELGQKAPRPLRSGLRIDKARRELQTRLWSAEESLRHMKAAQPA